ncbi:hypothetical protein C900_00013 [Fulvivirga imtechensis AK7]|uniref:N-formylglutamate amidohydrolase n=1 Tax=Fulvivirga imtechensis AK7 TaxID=1237149 RepID=L8K1P5_9BACT|nr:N-formylglutamate amidohydrolase [Fulvivirga imtechensis]ELR73849.1 hypothetical protein C900_00013 [Fulvivirga imtechensis AK7]
MARIKIQHGKSPIVVCAIHNGHNIRPEVLPYLNLSEAERLREEDPYTTEWLYISDNTIKLTVSRFELDINRPREKAVYLKPEDAWDLQVWKQDLPQQIVDNSLQLYDEFYDQIEAYFDQLFHEHEWLVIYDLHSYNYRRGGVDQYSSPEGNPEINLGTQNLNRSVWTPVIDTMLQSFREFNFEGRHLDVRENVKFGGGYFSKWLYQKYGDRICPVALEFKKFFMDEWTGEQDDRKIQHIRELLIASINPVKEAASKIKVSV